MEVRCLVIGNVRVVMEGIKSAKKGERERRSKGELDVGKKARKWR